MTVTSTHAVSTHLLLHKLPLALLMLLKLQEARRGATDILKLALDRYLAINLETRRRETQSDRVSTQPLQA